MVPALAKAVVAFFNKLIGIYSCYCTLLISSLSWVPQGGGPKPQYSSEGLTTAGGRSAGGVGLAHSLSKVPPAWISFPGRRWEPALRCRT